VQIQVGPQAANIPAFNSCSVLIERNVRIDHLTQLFHTDLTPTFIRERHFHMLANIICSVLITHFRHPVTSHCVQTIRYSLLTGFEGSLLLEHTSRDADRG
jgi:hypothetical protein